jgi:uncharacterized repeat protein (TIGR01451 family)
MIERYRARLLRACTRLRAWTAVLACLAATALAPAQSVTGDFIPGLASAFGGVATEPNAPGGFTILVDDDDDPLTPPVAYNLAAQTPALVAQTNYFLSPSRRFLYVLEDNSQGTTASRLWFARLDGMGGISIVHGPYSISGQMGPGRVLQGPFYYESFGGLNTAYLILGQPNGSEVWAQVFDLNTPGLSGQARVTLSAGLGAGSFAPSGTHLVIKNGISDIDTQNVDFTLINVCGVGGDFGLASDIRVPSSDIPPDPVFSVTAIGSGTIDVVGQIPGQPNPVFAQTLPDCVDAQPPVLGACCFDFGGSTVCSDGVTAFQCGNGNFFPSMTCDQVCPQPEVEIFGGAPTAIGAGSPLTYSFTVLNTGSVPATNVVVSARSPAGQTITSVSVADLIFNGSTSVQWTIPTLAPGADRTFTMTVTTPCAPGVIDLPMTAYEARIGFTVYRGNDLSTQVLTQGGGMITLAVASAASNGEPAIQGDFVTHTLTMTNSGSTAATGLRLQCIRLGPGNSLDAVLDDAGGTVTPNDCAPGFLTWEGDLPPMSTRTLVLRTRIDCVQQQNPGGPFGVWLNQGAEIALRGGPPCNDIVARVTARPVPTLPPMRSALAYSEVNPGTLRFHQNSLTPFFGSVIGLGRLGEEAEILITIDNPAGPDLANASFEYILGETFEAAATPFVGTPPAGVTWDPTTEAVRYTGPLATGDSIEVRLRAVMSSIRRPDDRVTLSSGSGCSLPIFPTRSASIYAVPEPSGLAEVHAVSAFNHYRFDDPILGAPDAELPAFWIEGLASIGAGSDGTLYVREILASYLINPATLNFAVFPQPAVPQDADPISGGVLHADQSSLWRYLPDGTSQEVYRDTTGMAGPGRACVTNDGLIHLIVNDPATSVRSVMTLDPAAGPLPLDAPALASAVAPPAVPLSYDSAFGPVLSRDFAGLIDDGTDLYATVTTTYDGLPGTPGVTQVIALVRIDPTSGAVTVLEPELSISRALDAPPLPMDASPTFATNVTGLLLYDPAQGPVFALGFNSGFATIDPSGIPTAYVGLASGDRLRGLTYLGVRCGIADLNADGLLTFTDITLFTQAFANGDASVDFAAPFGQLTFADVSAFLAAFSAGCP